MKHNTTTAAAVAEVATAAAMNVNEINAAAIEAAKGCHTCKEIAAKFSELCTQFGKENAVKIQATAKALLKDNNAATKDAAAEVVNTLKDGAKVAAAAWRALLAEDSNGARWARVVYQSVNCNLSELVVKYASYIAEDANGAKVAAVKVTTKDENGETITEYKPRNLENVGGYLAALKLAVRNAKRAALGEPRAKWQKEISF